jgi:murein DD-endopeptidase MepM/ murein hydrolase activator NlpD
MHHREIRAEMIRRSRIQHECEGRDARRVVSLRPATLALVVLIFTFVTAWAGVVTWYVTSSDDVTAELLRREARLKAGYEESIAILRGRLDRVASQKLLEQDSLEERVAKLMGRQVELETRQALLFNLGQNFEVAGITWPSFEAFETEPVQVYSGSAFGIGGPQVAMPKGTALSRHEITRSQPQQSTRPRPVPVARDDRGSIPGADRGRAPEVPATIETSPGKPFELRLRDAEPRASLVLDEKVLNAQLQDVEYSLARVEADQFTRLDVLTRHLAADARRLRDIIAETGLDADMLDAFDPLEEASGTYAETGIGGPYMPISLDPEAGGFEAMVHVLQETVLERERLSRTAHALPLARPAASRFGVSSGFGMRRDPFTRRPALHGGLDFRTPTGTSIRAAGPGRVTIASYRGGYGNLVEIDHGNDVTTRYAHLSSIAVEKGQFVGAGEHIGRAGSTGRSTGPHLHYETRIGDKPVDPQRFLRAGRQLSEHLADQEPKNQGFDAGSGRVQ